MKIIQLGLSNNLGGIEIYIKTMWDQIDRERFHFSFIDMTGENDRPCFYDELKKGGCDFYKITPRRVSPSRNREEMFELFEKHKFDVLHFNANTLSYMLPIEAAVKNGCKAIVHAHSSKTARIVPRTLHAWRENGFTGTEIFRCI